MKYCNFCGYYYTYKDCACFVYSDSSEELDECCKNSNSKNNEVDYALSTCEIEDGLSFESRVLSFEVIPETPYLLELSPVSVITSSTLYNSEPIPETSYNLFQLSRPFVPGDLTFYSMDGNDGYNKPQGLQFDCLELYDFFSFTLCVKEIGYINLSFRVTLEDTSYVSTFSYQKVTSDVEEIVLYSPYHIYGGNLITGKAIVRAVSCFEIYSATCKIASVDASYIVSQCPPEEYLDDFDDGGLNDCVYNTLPQSFQKYNSLQEIYDYINSLENLFFEKDVYDDIGSLYHDNLSYLTFPNYYSANRDADVDISSLKVSNDLGFVLSYDKHSLILHFLSNVALFGLFIVFKIDSQGSENESIGICTSSSSLFEFTEFFYNESGYYLMSLKSSYWPRAEDHDPSSVATSFGSNICIKNFDGDGINTVEVIRVFTFSRDVNLDCYFGHGGPYRGCQRVVNEDLHLVSYSGPLDEIDTNLDLVHPYILANQEEYPYVHLGPDFDTHIGLAISAVSTVSYPTTFNGVDLLDNNKNVFCLFNTNDYIDFIIPDLPDGKQFQVMSIGLIGGSGTPLSERNESVRFTVQCLSGDSLEWRYNSNYYVYDSNDYYWYVTVRSKYTSSLSGFHDPYGVVMVPDCKKIRLLYNADLVEPNQFCLLRRVCINGFLTDDKLCEENEPEYKDCLTTTFIGDSTSTYNKHQTLFFGFGVVRNGIWCDPWSGNVHTYTAMVAGSRTTFHDVYPREKVDLDNDYLSNKIDSADYHPIDVLPDEIIDGESTEVKSFIKKVYYSDDFTVNQTKDILADFVELPNTTFSAQTPRDPTNKSLEDSRHYVHRFVLSRPVDISRAIFIFRMYIPDENVLAYFVNKKTFNGSVFVYVVFHNEGLNVDYKYLYTFNDTSSLDYSYHLKNYQLGNDPMFLCRVEDPMTGTYVGNPKQNGKMICHQCSYVTVYAGYDAFQCTSTSESNVDFDFNFNYWPMSLCGLSLQRYPFDDDDYLNCVSSNYSPPNYPIQRYEENVSESLYNLSHIVTLNPDISSRGYIARDLAGNLISNDLQQHGSQYNWYYHDCIFIKFLQQFDFVAFSVVLDFSNDVSVNDIYNLNIRLYREDINLTPICFNRNIYKSIANNGKFLFYVSMSDIGQSDFEYHIDPDASHFGMTSYLNLYITGTVSRESYVVISDLTFYGRVGSTNEFDDYTALVQSSDCLPPETFTDYYQAFSINDPFINNYDILHQFDGVYSLSSYASSMIDSYNGVYNANKDPDIYMYGDSIEFIPGYSFDLYALFAIDLHNIEHDFFIELYRDTELIDSFTIHFGDPELHTFESNLIYHPNKYKIARNLTKVVIDPLRSIFGYWFRFDGLIKQSLPLSTIESIYHAKDIDLFQDSFPSIIVDRYSAFLPQYTEYGIDVFDPPFNTTITISPADYSLGNVCSCPVGGKIMASQICHGFLCVFTFNAHIIKIRFNMGSYVKYEYDVTLSGKEFIENTKYIICINNLSFPTSNLYGYIHFNMDSYDSSVDVHYLRFI